MKVEIRCKSDNFLNLDELCDFQGNLKYRSEHDVKKIANSIKEYGFAFPFFVWCDAGGKNYLLDGHGRIEALKALALEGYDIPALPVIYVKANDRSEAKNLLLRVNSLYGQTDHEALLALIEEAGANIGDISFPDISFGSQDFGGESGVIFAPEVMPTIDTSEVDEGDIERASETAFDVAKNLDLVGFTCRSCHGRILVNKITIERYLRGENV